jgi:hypothetical protein
VGEEVAFRIDLEQGTAQTMPIVSMADVGLKERDDLQRWISDHPEIVEPDLLLVTAELDRWELKDKKVSDRLDVLFLDSDGALLVAELKRDQAPDTTDSQALKYAAYCSQLTVDDVIEEYSRYHKEDIETAKTEVVNHAPALADEELGPTRIRLVATGFGPSVTTVVLWLRDLGLDIGCVELRARRWSESSAVLTARQLLPPPAAEDYLVKRRRREESEEKKEARKRRRDSVGILLEAGTIDVGTELKLSLEAMTADWRPAVEKAIQENPHTGLAEWTASGNRNSALRWKLDGDEYSATGLVWKLLTDLKLDVTAVAGPDYWLLPDGRTLSQAASETGALDTTGSTSDGGPVAVVPTPSASSPGDDEPLVVEDEDGSVRPLDAPS